MAESLESERLEDEENLDIDKNIDSYGDDPAYSGDAFSILTNPGNKKVDYTNIAIINRAVFGSGGIDLKIIRNG